MMTRQRGLPRTPAPPARASSGPPLRGTALLPVVGLLVAAAGCLPPDITEEQRRFHRGCVVMLPGIESGAWVFRGTVEGLREAGLDRGIEIIEWGDRPFASMRNLRNIEANRDRAARIAARLVVLMGDHPGAPVTLVGYSGGGGMALLAADRLPEDASLDRLILIAAAVSPDYDLSYALERCDKGIVNFYSAWDWFIVGLGTEIFGTIDRKTTAAAGHVGFREEAGGLLERDGLVQIPWSWDWWCLGHAGGHRGWLARRWARDVLAPAIDPALRDLRP